jgi:hypothetical protein
MRRRAVWWACALLVALATAPAQAYLKFGVEVGAEIRKLTPVYGSHVVCAKSIEQADVVSTICHPGAPVCGFCGVFVTVSYSEIRNPRNVEFIST